MVALILALSAALCLARPASAQDQRTWEVNGIKLESGQVERLADDLAARTVDSVDRNVRDLDLTDEQRAGMRKIYRSVALDVYAQVIEVIGRDDLDAEARNRKIRELALVGEKRSSERLRQLLDARQMELYSAWAADQVEAFQSRRLDSRRRRRR